MDAENPAKEEEGGIIMSCNTKKQRRDKEQNVPSKQKLTVATAIAFHVRNIERVFFHFSSPPLPPLSLPS